MRIKFLLILSAALVLISCTSNNAATPLPTVDLNAPVTKPTTAPSSNGGRGTPAASGIVVPENEAQLAFTVSGTLKKVNFSEGDQVTAGQVLAELDNAANQRALEQAQRDLKELTSPAAQADAAQALAVAQQNLKDQQDKVNAQFYRRASDTLIQKTQSQIELAKQAVTRATDTYRLVARLENDNSRKAEAVLALTNAQLNAQSPDRWISSSCSATRIKGPSRNNFRI